MANAVYNKAKESFLKGEIKWLTDEIKICLIDTTLYTVNIASHQFLSDVAPSAIVATSGVLSGKTATNGVADAADVTFTNGIVSTVRAIIIFKNGGVSNLSPLIAYIDTADDLPIVQTNSPVAVLWDEGSNKIFKL